jgi:hypothetical protein
MRGLLLGCAASLAALVPTAPAEAFDPRGPQFTPDSTGVTVHRAKLVDSVASFRKDRHDRRGRHDRRRDSRHGFDGGFLVYDREWQGDTAWRHDSYNDWWHERPHRSYPRWLESNDDCQRMWWSGGGWRC